MMINWLYIFQFSGLNQDLPPNVVLHTLEPWGENSLLLRLEHILEVNEDIQLSQPATVAFEVVLIIFTDIFMKRIKNIFQDALHCV